MKITDLLSESKQINEAPLGLMKRTGLGIKKAFGSKKAAGELDTGKSANSIKDQYMNMLGKTGEEASAENIIDFLKSNGYPTGKASQVLGIPPAQTPNPAADQAAQVRKDKQTAAASAAQGQMTAKPVSATPAAPTPAEIRAKKQADAASAAQGQMAANPAAPKKQATTPSPATTPAPNAAAPAAKPKGEPDAMGRIEPTLDMPPAEKPKGSFNNQTAGGKQSISTGGSFDPATMKNVPGQPVDTNTVPTAQRPRTAAPAPVEKPASRPQGGGKVPGQLSNTPQAQAKRASRAGTTAPAATPTAGANAFGQMVNQVTKKEQPRKKIGESIDLLEALSDKQIDAAFLAASQEKAKGGSAATKTAAPTASAPSAAPSAASAKSDEPGIGGSLGNVAKGLLTPNKWKQKDRSMGSGMGSTDDVLDDIDTRVLKQGLLLALKGEALDDKSSAEIKKLYDKL